MKIKMPTEPFFISLFRSGDILFIDVLGGFAPATVTSPVEISLENVHLKLPSSKLVIGIQGNPFFSEKNLPECTQGSTPEDAAVSTDKLAYHPIFIAKKCLTTPENSSGIR
jgi:hypothetical protein